MKKILSLLIVSVLIFFTSCKSLKVEKPVESYNPPVISPKPSVITVPIEVDIASLQSMINSKVTGLLYEDKSLEDNNNDNTMIKAWKKEDITFSINGNELSYRLPLKLWVKTGFKFEKLGITLSDYYDLNAAIALRYKTRIFIDKNWNVATSTSSEGYEWLESPTLRIGTFDVPVKFIADMVMKAGQKKINEEIDKALSKYITLKKMIQGPWVSLQNPIKVNDEYKLWLKVSPQEIYATPFTSANNKIKMSVGIKSYLETFMSTEAPKTTPNNNLPPLTIASKLDDSFLINVATDITYPVATEMARKQLQGKMFKQGKKTIIIKDIELYGSNGYLVVSVDVEGSARGKVYLTGIPYYDPEKQTISVKEFDFEMKTKNVLLKSANWLLHDTFLKMMQPYLSFPIGDKLADSRQMIQNQLSNNRIQKNILLNGNIQDLKIDTVVLTQESIKANAVMKGKITVTADSF